MASTSGVGLLVMAYGSPQDSTDDRQLEAYLHHILNEYAPPGRTVERVPPPAVADLKRRYGAIGSFSPLAEITSRQARALEARLNATGGLDGRPVRAAVGMKHFPPWIADAVAELAQEGVQDAVALVMAPHFSRMSVGGYLRAVREANERLTARLVVREIESWHTEARFIELLTARVRAALESAGWSLDEAAIVFSAHSLPERIREWDDPYPEQLLESAALIARGLGNPSWVVAYQSEGRGHEPWLGPSLAKTIEALALDGVRRVLVCPTGFVADHLEILYDLDIECENVAKRNGVELRRTASLNDDPDFIDALAQIVRNAWAAGGRHPSPSA